MNEKETLKETISVSKDNSNLIELLDFKKRKETLLSKSTFKN